MASSLAIMPRSPWLASLGCTKNAGVPVEAKVAASFWPTWPLLPMPVTITRPLAPDSNSTASPNAWPSCWCQRRPQRDQALAFQLQGARRRLHGDRPIAGHGAQLSLRHCFLHVASNWPETAV